ncbi:putative phenylalanine--tRNA ligase alpha subunit [Acorus calamus]|uniref:phenylalanine--tRNA ligase n=1 Tax=Acorus calamus TaxID=4465 RepID=A0AAV9FDI9_ACOCL|nr:putative phenylalanine--tRNA ligase alpha subunit [Acorus calamus]
MGDKEEKSAEGQAVLDFLYENDEISNTGDFASAAGIDHELVVNVIKSFSARRIVDAQDIKTEKYVLTDEGKSYAADGSPECRFFLAVPPEGISPDALQKKMDPALYKIGRTQAFRNKWVGVENSLLRRKAIGKDDIEDLKRRKLIILKTWKGFSVRKGPEYTRDHKKGPTDITRDHILSGEWKNLKFNQFNCNAQGKYVEGGHLHPLLKVREQFRKIFLEMGFEEMPTNNYVESSFWNFDALFQPQQHPARDSHDTFFLKVPSTTKQLPEDYVERVKNVHESGGYGSKGYNYEWKRDEAEKNLLRTHTTAVSSRMLYLLAQKPSFPKRYFSIDRVFRNEAVDRTHLAEFHQIEGVICDHGLSLADLIKVLKDFFARLGMSKLRFKPAYNPYTSPSMEIFSYHEGFKKWVEVGNSGMFRPEMLRPMGLPEDITVIAWGLSLERPTMILYGYDNIRDLFGHKVNLKLIKENQICRLGIK